MNLHRIAFNAMGCPCEFQLEAAAVDVRRAAALAQAEVERLDRKYSHYRDDSLVADIGRSADSGATLQVDAETANLLDFCDSLYRQSDARFDITAGSLTRLWDPQHVHVPSQAQIDTALRQCGWQHVRWKRPSLRLTLPGMRLDLGGVVKEYAADRAAEICRAAGVAHGVVDLGGDLAIIGAHADGRRWIAGIKAPCAPGAIARIEIAAGGLATSGDYERCMVVDGKRYSHILDARSGWPVTSFASVSVVASSCLVAGAGATLAMLLGLDEGARWLEALGCPYFCVADDGAMSGTFAQAAS